MFIDTHCHLNLMVKKEFNRALTEQECDNVQTIINEAAAHDVMRMVTVGTSLIESQNCIKIAKRYSNVFAAVGIHPTDTTASWKDDLTAIKKLIKDDIAKKIVAIGEVGLDFYWPDYNKQRQHNAFCAQIELALEHDLALIMHVRNAEEELLHHIEPYAQEFPLAVLHCYSSDDLSFAHEVIALGCKLGIGGVITYPKNRGLRTVIQQLPLDSLVLETDAPFLPPQPIRGKQNHPLQVATIAQTVAKLHTLSIEQVAEATTANATSLFRFSTK